MGQPSFRAIFLEVACQGPPPDSEAGSQNRVKDKHLIWEALLGNWQVGQGGRVTKGISPVPWVALPEAQERAGKTF